jgi:hypothetical protein
MRQAADKIGLEELAMHLAASTSLVEAWMQGLATVPDRTFSMLADVLLLPRKVAKGSAQWNRSDSSFNYTPSSRIDVREALRELGRTAVQEVQSPANPESLVEDQLKLIVGIKGGRVVIGSTSRARSIPPRQASWRSGHISYSVYLCHWIVIILAQAALVHLWPDLTKPVHCLSLLAMTLAISVALSYASHRLIESPGIRLGRRLAARQTRQEAPGLQKILPKSANWLKPAERRLRLRCADFLEALKRSPPGMQPYVHDLRVLIARLARPLARTRTPWSCRSSKASLVVSCLTCHVVEGPY